MLGSTNTETARANWTTVPGRKTTLTYNADGKPVKETYYDTDGTTIIFAVNYVYNADGKPVEINCTEN